MSYKINEISVGKSFDSHLKIQSQEDKGDSLKAKFSKHNTAVKKYNSKESLYYSNKKSEKSLLLAVKVSAVILSVFVIAVVFGLFLPVVLPIVIAIIGAVVAGVVTGALAIAYKVFEDKGTASRITRGTLEDAALTLQGEEDKLLLKFKEENEENNKGPENLISPRSPQERWIARHKPRNEDEDVGPQTPPRTTRTTRTTRSNFNPTDMDNETPPPTPPRKNRPVSLRLLSEAMGED